LLFVYQFQSRKQKPPRLQLATTRRIHMNWMTNIQPRRTGNALLRYKQRRFLASKVAKVLHSLSEDEKILMERQEFFDLGKKIAKQHRLKFNDLSPWWTPMLEDYYEITMADFPEIGSFQVQLFSRNV